LEGDYRPEHVASAAVELNDFYGEQLKACDLEIERQLAAFVPKVDLNQQPLPLNSPFDNLSQEESSPARQTCTLPDGRSGFNLKWMD